MTVRHENLPSSSGDLAHFQQPGMCEQVIYLGAEDVDLSKEDDISNGACIPITSQ